MKCTSLWQPWASLWLSDRKLHETRGRPLSYRGPIAVHAAKRKLRGWEYDTLPKAFKKILEDEFGGHWAMDLPYGAIIGVVTIIDCIPTEKLYDPEVAHMDSDDWLCGNFNEGRYAWKRGPKFTRLERPIPYIGQQGFFNIPDDLIQVAV